MVNFVLFLTSLWWIFRWSHNVYTNIRYTWCVSTSITPLMVKNPKVFMDINAKTYFLCLFLCNRLEYIARLNNAVLVIFWSLSYGFCQWARHRSIFHLGIWLEEMRRKLTMLMDCINVILWHLVWGVSRLGFLKQ